MSHLDITTSKLSHRKTKQTFRDLWLGSNKQPLIGIQGVKLLYSLSNYVLLKGLNFVFGIQNAQDSEYTG